MNYVVDEELIIQIDDSVDLFLYASQIMDFKKSGDSYFAHCPLHIDKTPSLCIRPKDNAFYCFSCGRSGRLISFLMTYEGLTFDEAIEKGLRLSGIDPNTLCKSYTMSFLRELKKVNRSVPTLSEHEVLDRSILNKYEKDYPKEWLDEGISKEAMDRYEIMIDSWNNRIVYPVYDLDGQLINVKGRTRYKEYKKMKIPKYINYFKVNILDYFQGLNIAIGDIKAKNEVIIFEGLKSIMKAYDMGYKNCVSSEKHNLTDEQISLLVKLRVNVVLAYDSDVDYQENNLRGKINKLKRVTNVYIIYDTKKLLVEKMSPVDAGQDIWEELYSSKKKVV